MNHGAASLPPPSLQEILADLDLLSEVEELIDAGQTFSDDADSILHRPDEIESNFQEISVHRDDVVEEYNHVQRRRITTTCSSLTTPWSSVRWTTIIPLNGGEAEDYHFV